MAAVLWLAALSATAQRSVQDYVVTTAGDTLRGRVQLSGRNNQTVTLYSRGRSAVRFSAADLRSYGDAAGPIGVSRTVGPHGATPGFVHLLVQGYVSLYSGQSVTGDKRFYLQPADTTYLVEVPPGSAEQLMLLRVLPGCPQLRLERSESLRLYTYTDAGMTRLVQEYNACRQPQQLSSTARRTSGGLRLRGGVKVGVNTLRTPAALDPTTQQRRLGYQVGGFLTFTTKSRFSVQVEATYLRLRQQAGPGRIANGYAYYQTIRTTKAQYSQVQLPLLFRYSPGHSSVRPYLNLGPNFGVNFSHASTITDEYVTSTGQVPPPTQRTTYAASPGVGLGLAAGAGLLVNSAGRPPLSLEVRYDRMLHGTGTSIPWHNTLRFDLGVTF